MGTHHPLQLLLVAAAAAAAAEVVVVRNTGQKYYSLARSPLRLPGSADFCSYLFLLFPAAAAVVLLLLLLLRWQAATPKIEPLPAANPHGSEGRKSIKIAPKNCLM